MKVKQICVERSEQPKGFQDIGIISVQKNNNRSPLSLNRN